MKVISAIVTCIFVSVLWWVNSGYTYTPMTKSLGSVSYSKDTTKVATTTKQGAQGSASPKGNATTTSAVRIVTHIKTPEHVKAIYMSSWVASTPSIRARLVKLIDTTELNAVVIDVKDNTGLVSWDGRVRDMPTLIDELHGKNIYVIARVASFQDPLYVSKHPELAVKNSATGGIWRDNKGVPWIDTGSQDMWKYLVGIGKQAYAMGFDEINYDYIRFPTDGKLALMDFPISKERGKTDKHGIVREFYKFLHDELSVKGIPISGDIFGIVMVTKVDIPVLGQDLHDALTYFDYVAPMVYPSHFYAGTDGYQNPAANPGPIINFAFAQASTTFAETASSTGLTSAQLYAKMRPWYQDFNMGATYTKEMVRAQIDAGEKWDVTSWMLWDPGNHYTPAALRQE
jgi:hypothetical protein